MIKNLGIVVLWGQFFAAGAVAFPVQVSEAPGNLLQTTLAAIRSAKESLEINIYELKSPEIAEAIVDKVESGVPVRMLMEGNPVGGMSDAGKKIRSSIARAMNGASAHQSCHLFVMTKPEQGKRRFHFDHAKYAVIDEARALVASENFSSSDTTKKLKNRGWQVVLHDPSSARHFEALFRHDADPRADDIEDLVKDATFNPVRALTRWSGTEAWIPAANRVTPMALDSADILEADEREFVTSPETSLSGLQAFIEGASEDLNLELMSFSPRWGTTGEKSPLLASVIKTARRGVKVRVLLNDESVFGGGGALDASSKNEETVTLLNDLAASESLKLEARIADVKAMKVSYIHNKGAIADSKRVLVSSINWNQNSVENNRETAVVLSSASVAAHFEALFQRDWRASADLR